MQAITLNKHGADDKLRLSEHPTPALRDDAVLVKVMTAAVNRADNFSGMLPQLPWKPRRLGSDMAGIVEAAGRNVTRFKPGDRVYGDLSASGRGAFAEYVSAPAAVLAPMPKRLSFAQAAAVPMTGVTALQGLQKVGKLTAADTILVNGASGGVGTFAVQIANAVGATVTGVCSSSNIEMVRALGATHVIDYRETDFTEQPERYDLIFDTVGNHSVAAFRRVLRPNGRFVTTTFMLPLLLQGWWLRLRHGVTMRAMFAQPNATDLAQLSTLIDDDHITPVIDRCYPLSEVGDALQYVSTGRARGKVIIVVHDHE